MNIPGKSETQPPLGILMLETQFPRPVGDIGNPATWPFPVEYRVVPDASPDQVVIKDPTRLLPRFLTAANELVQAGCVGVTTTCGFLVLIQAQLAEAVPVPVATSALLQVPMLQRLLPSNKCVGVLTISAKSLTHRHMKCAGIEEPHRVPVVDLDHQGVFAQGILNDLPSLSQVDCEFEMVEAASRLIEQHPNVGAIVLECTNMVPYAAEVQAHTGKPVFSIYSLSTQFYAGLQPQRFSS